MSKETLLALIIWAIDRDLLEAPVVKALELFNKDAVRCQKTFTDPSDELLYIEGMENIDPIVFFTDYVLCYAKLRSGLRDYGKYEKAIINYRNKQFKL